MQKVLKLTSYRDSSLSHRIFPAMKRIADIFLSFAALIVLLPVLFLIAIIAAVDTKAFPIFVQTRMGRYNQPFKMYKFRTMSTKAPCNVATRDLIDPNKYISKIGNLFRHTSIDELPQLMNILLGQMSFVGPRPVVMCETELIELRTRNGACNVRPGLTGIAQTSGRDKVTIYDKAKMDAFYANNLSFSMDARILYATVGYVLRSKDIHDGAIPQEKPMVKACRKNRTA